MDLTTRYLGLELASPFLPGASPLADDLRTARALEDAGAAAIVLRSLFEEQLTVDASATMRHAHTYEDVYAEALSYFPVDEAFALGPDEYLEQIFQLKRRVGVPVIGSLNGQSLGAWMKFARLIQQAGADAIELNVYRVVTDFAESASDVENGVCEMLEGVKSNLSIPVAIKLSPYYSAFANFAKRLDDIGVDGIVLFNRFYQPDIDPDHLDVKRSLQLSTSRELRLRLRWLAILSGHLRASLAVTGGIHTAEDVAKAIMAGADVVQVVSALLHNGPGHLRHLRDGFEAWMERQEYETLEAIRGSMNLSQCPQPQAFERANYTDILQGWDA